MTRIFLGVAAATAVVAATETAVQTNRDVAYGADMAQRLDLSVPAARDYPTVIFVHGGGLTGGDKADADYGRVCEPFPAAGIACANVNYRLLPGGSWPAPAEDVAAATAWVHRNIGSRGGNPNRLFLLGHSSGAILVALIGADARYLSAQKLTAAVLAGVLPMGSIMWDDDLRKSIEKNGREKVEAAFASRDPGGKGFGSLDRYESQWPINYVRAGLPPYLFLIAESEQINPPILSTNQKFVDEARTRGNQADLRIFAGRTHYSNIRKLHEPGDEVFAAVLAFVREAAFVRINAVQTEFKNYLRSRHSLRRQRRRGRLSISRRCSTNSDTRASRSLRRPAPVTHRSRH